MTGKDKFDEARKKLHNDADTKVEEDKREMAEVKSDLLALADNEEMAKRYQDNANVGADNISGTLPLLKVYSAGRSKSVLSNGQKPNDGWFYYGPTKEQFEKPVCHILTISHGFRAPGLEKGKLVFNQIMGGVIVDKEDEQLKPFLMFFTGKKLQNLWSFGKEISPYTKQKPIPFPMFTLTVMLSTHSEENNFGTDSHVVDFEVLKTDSGDPQVILDPVLFDYLKTNVTKLEETIEKLIEARSSEEDEPGVVTGRVADVRGNEPPVRDPEPF